MRFPVHADLAVLAVAALGALATPAALAQPDPSLSGVSLPRLEGMVATCDLPAPRSQPQTVTQAFCAAAADELRQRAFAGDHQRLLAWWRERRAATQAPADAGRPAASTPLGVATPAQLQATYLACERQAQATVLDFGAAAVCSMVYEELKRRVFGGDFDRLHDWWRQQQAAAAAAARLTATETQPHRAQLPTAVPPSARLRP